MKKFIDVSHTVKHGMITYKGLPAPVVCDFLSRDDSRAHYATGTSFQIGKIEMVANTGTYIDSPFHRFADGADLSGLDLKRIADLEGVVFQTDPARRSIGAELFEGADLGNKAVLIHTGWSRHWGTDQYFEGHPFLTAAAAETLKASGASLVGIDSLNIDDTSDGTRPVHTILLGAGIPIVEHLCNLESVPASGFRFHAVPVKISGFGSFPVRAYIMTGS